ncbi:hypothetical protein RN001_007438 [Aquatica leii]|uniref:Uncharacterized protein n=1 Tax=Aquatica leii TaxID=1421715 RepID=A0AAN7PY55_9COLE|nr:hypothetical protein RN001_007438 [Aquatica leii]
MDADSSYGGSDTAQDSTLGHDSNSLETSISNHTSTVHNHHDEVDKSVMPSNDTNTYFKNEVTLPINYDDKNPEKSSIPHYLSTAKLNIEDDNRDNINDSKNYSSTHNLNEETPKSKKKPNNSGIDNPAFQADEKSNHQPSNGALKSTFDENKAFTNGDLNATPLGFTSPTKNEEHMAEAVNLELINLKPVGKDVGGYDGSNGINDIPIKKETEVEIGNPYDEYFVPVNEHRKYMRGEKLYVTKDKRDKKKRNKCLCWSLCLVLVAAAVIVGILAAVGIIGTQEAHPVQEARHFSDSPKVEDSEIKSAGGIFGISDRNKHTYPHTPEPPISTMKSMPTTDTSRIEVPRALESEIIIDNLVFHEALSHRNSTEFKDLAENLEQLLKIALFSNDMSMYDPTNVELKIMEFMPGSVRAKFRIGWIFENEDDNTNDPINPETLKQRLINTLNENYGYLEEYHIPETTITSEKIINMCHIENNGCEHSCNFDYKLLNFMCECPPYQQLDIDEKSCISVHQNYYPVSTEPETMTDFEFESPKHHDLEHGRSYEPTSKMVPHSTAKPEPSPIAEPTPEPTVVPEPEPSAEPESKPEPIPTSKPEPDFEPTSKSEPEPNPEPTSKPEPEPTVKPEPEPTVKPEPEPTSKPEPEPTSKPEPEPTSKPEPEPTSKPEPEPTSKPEPEPTSKPEPEPTSKPEPEPTSKPEPEPTTKPEPEPTSKPEPEPTANPEPEPTSKPEPTHKPELEVTNKPESKVTQRKEEDETHGRSKSIYEFISEPESTPEPSSKSESKPTSTETPNDNLHAMVFSHSETTTTHEPEHEPESEPELPIEPESEFDEEPEILIHSQHEATTHSQPTTHMQLEIKPTILSDIITKTTTEFDPEMHTSKEFEYATQYHAQTERIHEVTLLPHSSSTHSENILLPQTTTYSTNKEHDHMQNNTVTENSTAVMGTNNTVLENIPMMEHNHEYNDTFVHGVEVHITIPELEESENKTKTFNSSGREAKLSDESFDSIADNFLNVNHTTIDPNILYATTTMNPEDTKMMMNNTNLDTTDATKKLSVSEITTIVNTSTLDENEKTIDTGRKIILNQTEDVANTVEITKPLTKAIESKEMDKETTQNNTVSIVTMNKVEVKDTTEKIATTTLMHDVSTNTMHTPVITDNQTKNNHAEVLVEHTSTENVIEAQSHDFIENSNVENMSPFLPEIENDTIVKTLNAELEQNTESPNKNEMYVITENPPRLDNDEMNVTNPFDPNPTDTTVGVLSINQNKTVTNKSNIVNEIENNNTKLSEFSTTSTTSKRPSLSPDIINNIHSNNLFFKLHTSTDSSVTQTEPIPIKNEISNSKEKDISTEDLLALETTTYKQSNIKNLTTAKQEMQAITEIIPIVKNKSENVIHANAEKINETNFVTTTMHPLSSESHQYEVHENLFEDITTPSLLKLQKTFRDSDPPLPVIPLVEEKHEKKRTDNDLFNKLDSFETIYDPRDLINDINDEDQYFITTTTELPKDNNTGSDNENVVSKFNEDEENDHYLATDFTNKYTFTTPPANNTSEDFYLEQIKKANMSREDVKPVTEEFSFTHFSRCPTGQFQCLNGTSMKSSSYCISNSDRCDSVDDCTDASDEIGCTQEQCLENFQCNNGQCLKRQLVCNGMSDCLDGSDESDCMSWKCRFDEFSCGEGHRCIPLSMKCDGRNDCPKGEDEYHCYTQNCQPNSYRCVTQDTCIPASWKCDGKLDCDGGDDENSCECNKNEFKCMKGGGCIPRDQMCDGIQQCPDLSDEWNCLRLQEANNSMIHTSIVEVQTMNTTWLQICSDLWNNFYSNLVCQSLGFAEASTTEFINIDNTTLKYFKLRNSEHQSSHILTQLETTNKCESVVSVTCQEFECGSQASLDVQSARIIGGSRATETQWPSVTFLYDKKQHKQCTSTLIAPRWAIASYSCVFGKESMLSNKFEWSLYAGGTNFSVNTDNSTTQIRLVASLIPHPQVKFVEFVYTNDIVLVELESPLTLGPNVSAICLPNNEIEPRQLCVTAGWGINQPGETDRHQYLNYLPVPTIDVDNCNSTEHYNGRLTEDKICAGYTDSDKTPCYNDEGAPLMCFSDASNTWELRGLLSYHANCGRSRHPALYSSINKDTRQWISHTIGLQLMMNQRVALNKK